LLLGNEGLGVPGFSSADLGAAFGTPSASFTSDPMSMAEQMSLSALSGSGVIPATPGFTPIPATPSPWAGRLRPRPASVSPDIFDILDEPIIRKRPRR
jgi:hypothetical protein